MGDLIILDHVPDITKRISPLDITVSIRYCITTELIDLHNDIYIAATIQTVCNITGPWTKFVIHGQVIYQPNRTIIITVPGIGHAANTQARHKH